MRRPAAETRARPICRHARFSPSPDAVSGAEKGECGLHRRPGAHFKRSRAVTRTRRGVRRRPEGRSAGRRSRARRCSRYFRGAKYTSGTTGGADHHVSKDGAWLDDQRVECGAQKAGRASWENSLMRTTTYKNRAGSGCARRMSPRSSRGRKLWGSAARAEARGAEVLPPGFSCALTCGGKSRRVMRVVGGCGRAGRGGE